MPNKLMPQQNSFYNKPCHNKPKQTQANYAMRKRSNQYLENRFLHSHSMSGDHPFISNT